ncbi:hypothetical protein SynA1524_00923 [Synechococcus sp. A15-24]|nr:hypothetical protein SynA1524_00923 [Synechococcus sp. A15-24]
MGDGTVVADAKWRLNGQLHVHSEGSSETRVLVVIRFIKLQ